MVRGWFLRQNVADRTRLGFQTLGIVQGKMLPAIGIIASSLLYNSFKPCKQGVEAGGGGYFGC
jgi:hypothetical protein